MTTETQPDPRPFATSEHNGFNTMRQTYRTLSDADKANMQAIKDEGQKFFDLVSGLTQSRETSLAKTKIEEAVMWAVKSITA